MDKKGYNISESCVTCFFSRYNGMNTNSDKSLVLYCTYYEEPLELKDFSNSNAYTKHFLSYVSRNKVEEFYVCDNFKSERN
jgi:hypothetical protein